MIIRLLWETSLNKLILFKKEVFNSLKTELSVKLYSMIPIEQQKALEVGSLALCCPLAVGWVPSIGQCQATVLMVSEYGSHLSNVSPRVFTSARLLLFNVQRGPHSTQKLGGRRIQYQKTAVSFYMNTAEGETDVRKCQINVPWLLVDTWGRLTWSAG